jgi:hypothetical protein
MKRLIVSALAAVFLAAAFATADTCSEPVDPRCYDHDSCLADDPSKCYYCAEGYYLVGGVAGECVQCPANCASCYGSDSDGDSAYCDYCEAGYGLSNDSTTCYACGEHCGNCSATECYQCNSGYVDSGDGQNCAACTTGCNYVCAPGYYAYSTGGDCGQCSDQIPMHCDHCREDDNSRCQQCAEGYHPNYYQAYDVDGSQCCSDEFCVNCNRDGRKCLECLAGWYADADGVCRLCDKPGCTCFAAGDDCLSCDSYFGLYYQLNHYVTGQDGEARCCYGGCTDCSLMWDDTSSGNWVINGSCTQCDAGRYLQSNGDEHHCVQCDWTGSGCAACTAGGGSQAVTCTACFPGYRYNANTKACGMCFAPFYGCGKCDADISVCEGCKSRHHEVRNELTGALLGCTECEHWGCLRCSAAPTVCDECARGHRLREHQDEEGENHTDCGACAEGFGGNPVESCMPCPRYCAKCDEALECHECSKGFYLTVRGYCTPLLLPGGTCDPVKYPNHTDCGSAQCLNAVCCAWDDEYCLSCSEENGLCKECADGYELNGNSTCEEYAENTTLTCPEALPWASTGPYSDDIPRQCVASCSELVPPRFRPSTGNTCVTGCRFSDEYLDSGVCVTHCPIERPYLTDDTRECTASCDELDPPRVLNAAGNSCVASCPPEHYVLTGKCSYNCEGSTWYADEVSGTCVADCRDLVPPRLNTDTSTSPIRHRCEDACSSGFNLNGECVTTCPSGYTADIGANRCVNACGAHCATCESDTTCSSCEASVGTQYFAQGGVCSEICVSGTLKLIRAHVGMCVNDCPNGTYQVSQDRCESCHASCHTCTESVATSCTTCDAKTRYLTLDGRCELHVAPGGMCDSTKYPASQDCAYACLDGVCCAAPVPSCTRCAVGTGKCSACEAGKPLRNELCGTLIGQEDDFNSTAPPTTGPPSALWGPATDDDDRAPVVASGAVLRCVWGSMAWAVIHSLVTTL